MALHPHGIKPIPSLTQEIAHKAFPKGQPALHPGRLALICVMQYMANLSDRGAVEAVATRIDWKYALELN